jgi:hypothetical protein
MEETPKRKQKTHKKRKKGGEAGKKTESWLASQLLLARGWASLVVSQHELTPYGPSQVIVVVEQGKGEVAAPQLFCVVETPAVSPSSQEETAKRLSSA